MDNTTDNPTASENEPSAATVPPESLLPLVIWSVEDATDTRWSVCHHVGPVDSEQHVCIASVKGPRARAEFIVRACNNYQPTLDALKLLVVRFPAAIAALPDDERDQVNAAIATVNALVSE